MDEGNNKDDNKNVKKMGLFVKGAAKELTSKDGRRKVKGFINAVKDVTNTFDINK